MAEQAPVVESINRLLGLLPSSKSRAFWVLLVGAAAVAVCETFALGVIALFVSSVSNPGAVLASSYVSPVVSFFPVLGEDGGKALLLCLSVAVVVLVLLKNAFRGLLQYHFQMLMAYVSGYLGETMLSGVMRMPYSWLIKENPADLMNTVQWAGNSGAFLSSVFVAVTEAILLLFLFLALLVADPFLTLLSIMLLAAPSALLLKALRKRIDRLAKEIAARRKSANRNMMTAIHGVKDVKVYGQEESFCDKFREDVYAAPRLAAEQEVASSVPGWALEVVGFAMLSLAVVLMYYVMGESSARITGVIALLAVSAWRGLPATIRLVTSVNRFRSYLPYVGDTLAHMEKIKQWAASPVPADGNSPSLSMDEVFSCKDVSFSYDENEGLALEAVSFDVRKGEAVGIVGESGAGKSTLMDILIGLLSPSSGKLYLDGIKLDQDALRHLTGITGYVPQAPYLYDATVAENIAFGLDGQQVDLRKVVDVSKQAAIHDLIMKLPLQYDTFLGERGIRLSGGQQQRVCIARALYTRPDILVFDEATSSLDTKSEKQIQKTLVSLKGKVTMIIVAHRLSTVEDCDKVVWIEQGKVKMVGPPNEVLPEYKKMLNSHESENEA